MFDDKELKVALAINCLIQNDLAKEYGCSKQFVSKVLSGKKKSKRLEKFIAERLGINPLESETV